MANRPLMGNGPLIKLVTSAEQPAPAEFRIWPEGVVRFRDGDSVLLDAEAMNTVLENWKADGVDIQIDYHHQATPEVVPDSPFIRPDRKAPAAGWCGLEARADGLWATNVRWTPTGEKEVSDREYRYISPSIYYDPDTGRVMVIRALSLTNTPLTVDAEPLVAQNNLGGEGLDKLQKFLTKVAQALGMTDDLTEEKALEAVTALKGDKDTLAKVAQALGLSGEVKAETLLAKAAEAVKTGQGQEGGLAAKVAQALGLAAEASESQILGAAKAAAAGSQGATELAAKVAALEETQAKDKAEALVAQAMKDGKITAAQEPWLKELAVKDLAQAEAFVAHAPQIVPTGAASKSTVVKPVQGLTAEEAKVAQMMGLDPEMVAKAAAKTPGRED